MTNAQRFADLANNFRQHAHDALESAAEYDASALQAVGYMSNIFRSRAAEARFRAADHEAAAAKFAALAAPRRGR